MVSKMCSLIISSPFRQNENITSCQKVNTWGGKYNDTKTSGRISQFTSLPRLIDLYLETIPQLG